MKYKLEKRKNFKIIKTKKNLFNKYLIMFKYKKKNISYFYEKNNFIFILFKIIKINKFFFYEYKKLIKNLIFLFCGFSYFKTFMKVGLGFRKKYCYTHDTMLFNIVKRKIVFFKPTSNSFFLHIRRRNIFVYSNSKRKLFNYIIRFKSLRKETIYKFKGIFTSVRVRFFKKMTKCVLFARRIKFKKLKLKLTRKQKLKK